MLIKQIFKKRGVKIKRKFTFNFEKQKKMKNSHLIFLFAFVYLNAISNKIICIKRHVKQSEQLPPPIVYLKAIKLGQLMSMFEAINVLELKKRQEEELRQRELDLARMVEKQKDELKRRSIIRSFLETRSGQTSVLKDFFTNRIL